MLADSSFNVTSLLTKRLFLVSQVIISLPQIASNSSSLIKKVLQKEKNTFKFDKI